MAIKQVIFEETGVWVSGTAIVTPEMEDIVRKAFARACRLAQNEMYITFARPPVAPTYQEIVKAIMWELEHRRLYKQEGEL